MSENSIAVASDVCTRIYRAGPFEYDHDRAWYDLASSQIALIAGEAPILYIDHNINSTGNDNRKAVIVAFTDHVAIIIDLTFTPNSNDNGKNLGARVIGRKSLSALSVGEVTNAIAYRNNDWPRRISLTLTYGSETFTLPFHSHNREGMPQLAALAPKLAEDLNT
jgi:hypothetical protein